MKKNLFLLLLGFLVLSGGIQAQRISISIPKASSKKYAFVLNKGLAKDTVQQGVFNFAGGLVVNIPSKYKGYSGVGELRIQGEKPITLVVNGENFTMERKDDRNMKFTNSPENDYLYAVAFGGQKRAPNKSLYSYHFVQIMDFVRVLDNMVTRGGDLGTRTNVRLYAMNELDMDRLYTSGFWHLAVDRLMRVSPMQEIVGEDMVKVFKRIKSQEVFVTLADNVITMMTQYGWDDAFDIIVPYIADSKRIPTPQGQIYDAFKMAKIRRGTVVPVIIGLRTPLKAGAYNKTLLMFYESDCKNCVTQLDELKKNYARLNASGVRIVTISADYDKVMFQKIASGLPWQDKLCDFKGFAGINFANYGVAGTPTFYLLDKNLRLVKRFALLKDANL